MLIKKKTPINLIAEKDWTELKHKYLDSYNVA